MNLTGEERVETCKAPRNRNKHYTGKCPLVPGNNIQMIGPCVLRGVDSCCNSKVSVISHVK